MWPHGLSLHSQRKLNIEPATIFPRATQHIPEMIAIIEGLLAKDIAYEVNCYVYFDIKRFPEYGKLSGNQLENMLAGAGAMHTHVHQHWPDHSHEHAHYHQNR